MTIVNQFISELRQSRLLPVVIVLLAALVAVPVLLTSSGGAAPKSLQASLPVAAPPLTALPALSVQTAASHTRLGGSGRDPFTQQGGSAPAMNGSSVPGAGALNAAVGGGSTLGGTSTLGKAPAGLAGGGSAGTGSSNVGSSVSGAANPPVSSPPVTPPSTQPSKPPPSGLNPYQAYNVAVAITDPSGGLNTIDPVERLSILPSKRQPLLVELGVLKGGRQVLFAVAPGAEVSGPGKCTPGPVDCEVLSLGEGQIETLGVDTASGTTPVADFAVTAITTKRYRTRAAASGARRKRSAAGKRLLNDSGLSSLSLFQYRPSIGAIVDLRNLKVGRG